AWRIFGGAPEGPSADGDHRHRPARLHGGNADACPLSRRRAPRSSAAQARAAAHHAGPARPSATGGARVRYAPRHAPAPRSGAALDGHAHDHFHGRSEPGLRLRLVSGVPHARRDRGRHAEAAALAGGRGKLCPALPDLRRPRRCRAGRAQARRAPARDDGRRLRGGAGEGSLTMPSGPDVSAFENRLRKNLAYRRKWARRYGISCFRVYDRDVPQFPFAVDWFGTVAPRTETHLHVQEIDTGWRMSPEDYAAWLAAVCAAACSVCEVPAAQLHLKHRERQRGTSQYEKDEEAAAEAFVVEEAGNRFEINLDTYLDTGLFLDHRPMRARVAETIERRAEAGAGTSFLNLFAYTGSFTVYAARAGASR